MLALANEPMRLTARVSAKGSDAVFMFDRLRLTSALPAGVRMLEDPMPWLWACSDGVVVFLHAVHGVGDVRSHYLVLPLEELAGFPSLHRYWAACLRDRTCEEAVSLLKVS